MSTYDYGYNLFKKIVNKECPMTNNIKLNEGVVTWELSL